GFVIAVALVVAVAARTVGSLIVSSMMVVPVACALQISRSWKQCCFYASAVGMLTSLGGLVISYELGLKPGGTIVLLAVVTLLFIFLVKRVVLLLKTHVV
ncbi:MAG: metal ABC transporter permease, partial [Lancefieldella parvula]